MGSPPPHQDQSKPVIKTSYSTNRKVKNGEAGTGNKRWKRRQEGNERSSEASQPVMTSTEALALAQNKHVSNQKCETGDKPRKAWARLKSLNSNPLMIGTKTKKGKAKAKKSKHFSPVKSSSSQKTITLSDGESELHTLKELNKICEGGRLSHSECGQGDSISLTSSYNDNSNLVEIENLEMQVTEPTSNDDSKFVEVETVKPVSSESVSCEESEIVLQRDDIVTYAESITSAVNEPLTWTISFDSPCRSSSSKDDLINWEVNEVNQSQKDFCSSLKCDEVNSRANQNGCDQNGSDFVPDNQPEACVEGVLNESPLQDSCIPNINMNVINNTDLPINKFPECISNSSQFQTNIENIVLFEKDGVCIMDYPGELLSTSKAQVNEVTNLLSFIESECESKTHSYSTEDQEKNEVNNCESASANWKDDIKRKLGRCCECPELIDYIRNFLDLLMSCKGHNQEWKSWAESQLRNSKQPKFKRKTRWKANSMSNRESLSDSELNCGSKCCFENACNGVVCHQCNFCRRMKNRNTCIASQIKSVLKPLKDASCQTECIKSSLSSHSDTPSLKLKENADLNQSNDNYLENLPHKGDSCSTTPKKGNVLSLCMGERLRDVRKLLSRSTDTLSNDTLDCQEEGFISHISPVGLDSHIHLEQNRECGENNEVVLTSVQRLFNSREVMNRRLALREQQIVNRLPSVNMAGSSRDSLCSGDAAPSFPRSTLLRLPPLGNSTHRRLNRRWSPSGDDRLTDSANTEEDGAIGRFCHECGGRYPVPGAKFCCLCGVRRLAV